MAALAAVALYRFRNSCERSRGFGPGTRLADGPGSLAVLRSAAAGSTPHHAALCGRAGHVALAVVLTHVAASGAAGDRRAGAACSGRCRGFRRTHRPGECFRNGALCRNTGRHELSAPSADHAAPGAAQACAPDDKAELHPAHDAGRMGPTARRAAAARAATAAYGRAAALSCDPRQIHGVHV